MTLLQSNGKVASLCLISLLRLSSAFVPSSELCRHDLARLPPGCPTRTTKGTAVYFAPPLRQSKWKQQFQQPTSCLVTRGKVSSSVRPLQASASPVLALFSSPLASLIILAGIVLVHESGHYLAARSFGIEVEEFSIGVGPKLFGFRAFGDEFNLRAIPLGGYVRFPENYNSTLVREQEQAALKAARDFDAQQESDLKYKLVNALTLGALDDSRRRKEKARRAKLRKESAQYTQQWWSRLLSSAKDEPDMLDIEDVKIEYYDDPKLLQNRPWFQRAVVLSAGVAFNLILAFFIYFGEISYGPGVPRPIFAPGALITATPQPGAAASGLLRKGDVIVAVNGGVVTRSPSPLASEAQKSISDLISTIRATPDGESLHLTIFRQGGDLPVQVDLRPKRVSDGPQTIGVLLSPNFVQSELIRATSLVDGSVKAAEYVGVLTRETAQGLLSIVGDVIKGKGAGNQISGPIGLIKTGSEVVATQDWSSILTFAAAISINLAVVNAFPLPALDGGQLLFVLSEAVSGRKVDQRLQEGITGATLLFLLLAAFGAAFSDIENILVR